MAPQHGLTQCYDGTDPVVDIVFVHGLLGHPRKTWTARRRRDEPSAASRSSSGVPASASGKPEPKEGILHKVGKAFHKGSQEPTSSARNGKSTFHSPSSSSTPDLGDQHGESAQQALPTGQQEVFGEDDTGEYTSESASDAEPSHDLENVVFWPEELLPSVFPHVRIFSFGYDANINHFLKSAEQNDVFNHSHNLLNDVANIEAPEGKPAIPLIFFAHSLGGIVVKGALASSHIAKTYWKDVLPRTRGVMFLGTPHRGSPSAGLAAVAERASKVLLRQPDLAGLEALQVDSEVLERVHKDFSGTLHDASHIEVHSFREEYRTKGVLIVPRFSSIMGLAIENEGSIPANHSNMTKFGDANDTGFVRIVGTLRHWITSIEMDASDTDPASLRLLGSEAEVTVAYPSEQDMMSIPSEPSWLRLLNHYKESFGEDDATLARETLRATRKDPRYATRLISVIDAWRVLSAEVSHRDESPLQIMNSSIIVNGMRFNTASSTASNHTTITAEYVGVDVDNYHDTAHVASALLAKQLFRKANVTPLGVHCMEKYHSTPGNFAHVTYPAAFAMDKVHLEHHYYLQDHRGWRTAFYAVFSPVLADLWADDQDTANSDEPSMADQVRSFCKPDATPPQIATDIERYATTTYWLLVLKVKRYLGTDSEAFEIEDVFNLLRPALLWPRSSQRAAMRPEALQFATAHFGPRAKWLVLILMLNVTHNFHRVSYLPKNFEDMMDQEYCLIS